MKIFLLILVLFFYSCKEKPPIKIQGVWTLESRNFTDIDPTSAVEYLPEEIFGAPYFNTLLIKDSTISFFRYPLQFLFTCKYKHAPNQLSVIQIESDFFDSYQIKLNDSLLVFTEKVNSSEWSEIIESYALDSLNLASLDLLEKDTINYESLLGKWELEKFIHLNDGSEPYEKRFPFVLPATLSFTSKDFKLEGKSNFLSLQIQGKKRRFKIVLYNQYHFRLIPYEWTPKDCPSIVYNRLPS
jgi:hypothetical protein